ncbi:MAG: sugar ABC transporter permease, partial [Acholeplasmatales bacterium]
MLEERHNFKAWLYLSPALVLLLVFTFYPIFNAFNLLFMYNFDYMQNERDGYTFFMHDPVRAERWAYREHWQSVLDVSVSPDGYVYSVSGTLSVHRTTLRGVPAGDFISTDPGVVLQALDIQNDTAYDVADVTAVFVDRSANIYLAVYDAEDDEYHLYQYRLSAGVWHEANVIYDVPNTTAI